MRTQHLHMYRKPTDRDIVETLTVDSMWESLAGHLNADEITCLCTLLRGAGANDTDLASIWEEWERQEPDAVAENVNNATEITSVDDEPLARIAPTRPSETIPENYKN